MGQLGELFPGAKLRRETPAEEGSGQGFAPGPLDLDSGVVRLRAAGPTAGPAADAPTAEGDAADESGE